ncbi:aldehyde dehydrogenase family protein, partial [bacterium]|nr:aldehyde dehydrogenase family protein [bacterium]
MTIQNNIADTVSSLRATYDSGKTRPLAWRKQQLEALVRMMKDNEATFSAALKTDLGKPDVEGFITDIAFVTSE